MASIAPSDSESNMSGFVRYSDKSFKHLYSSILEKMELINQDTLQLQNNMKNLIQQAGPLESQLTAVLLALPKPTTITMAMETE